MGYRTAGRRGRDQQLPHLTPRGRAYTIKHSGEFFSASRPRPSLVRGEACDRLIVSNDGSGGSLDEIQIEPLARWRLLHKSVLIRLFRFSWRIM